MMADKETKTTDTASDSNDSFVSVGEPHQTNYSKRLFDQLNDLKSTTNKISSDLCSMMSKTAISSITSDDIKNCAKLQKKHLGKQILALLQKCTALCHDNNLNFVATPAPPSEIASNTIVSEVSDCIKKALDNFTVSQDVKFKEINVQIAKLQSLSDYASNVPVHQNQNRGATEELLMYSDTILQKEITVENTTTHVDDYIEDFVSTDLSEKVISFLDQCQNFENNSESGHSVKLFGYPYHYVGSKHGNTTGTDIPEPISEVLQLLKNKYPDAELNSCLINKYVGPDSFLSRHSDNEFTIEPESSIYTVSLGHTTTVRFTDIHSEATQEQTVDPNSLYTMSRKSQGFWQHQIDRDNMSTNTSTRYSLTFRHVSERFLRSTVIVGDSNTRFLKFGEGQGKFGHLIPGKRTEAIHTKDIDPNECVSYKNIFIQWGVNDIKHYRVRGPAEVAECFDSFREKLDQIITVCPNSKIVVSPILPTKRSDWNDRAVHFNKLLFKYRTFTCDRFNTLKFGCFVDQSTGELKADLGRYWNSSDPLHLGHAGVLVLAKLIREQIFSSRIHSRMTYSEAAGGAGASARAGGYGAAGGSLADLAPP